MAGSKTYFPFTVREEIKGVKRLQELCRFSILNSVTLKNVQQVASLPLPNILKDFLCTFSIPEDFDLDGTFVDYNFNFPNHVHHKTHQIHPAKCLLDGSKILIKSEHSATPCKMCNNVGNKTMHRSKEREIWVRLKHTNLMNCHLRMQDFCSPLTCFIFDFPVMSLEDYIVKLFLAGKNIPEFLIWKVLKDLIDVLQYLQKFGLHPWAMCQPQHIVLDEAGTIKLENMLLYLPVKSGSHFNTDTRSCSLSKYTSPEKLKGQPEGPQTVAWGLGCILEELSAHIPTVLLNSEHATYFMRHFMKSTGVIYSKILTNVIKNCLHLNWRTRPTLKELQITSEQRLMMLKRDYVGPQTLIDLLPEVLQ